MEDGGDPLDSGGQRMTDGDSVPARSYEAGRTARSGAAGSLLKSPQPLTALQTGAGAGRRQTEL